MNSSFILCCYKRIVVFLSNKLTYIIDKRNNNNSNSNSISSCHHKVIVELNQFTWWTENSTKWLLTPEYACRLLSSMSTIANHSYLSSYCTIWSAGRRLSRPRYCAVQPMLKAVYHSSCCNKHIAAQCLWEDSILDLCRHITTRPRQHIGSYLIAWNFDRMWIVTEDDVTYNSIFSVIRYFGPELLFYFDWA